MGSLYELGVGDARGGGFQYFFYKGAFTVSVVVRGFISLVWGFAALVA